MTSAADELQTPGNAASTIIGYISLLSWMVVMFPQIYLNFRRKSGEGVSLVMTGAWIIGDLFNIAGAMMQGLVMSTIVVASYFLLVDATLFSQTIYYRTVYSAHTRVKAISGDDTGDAGDGVLPPANDTTALISHSDDGDVDAQSSLVPSQSSSHLTNALAFTLSLASLGCLAAVVISLIMPQPSGDDDGPRNPPSPPSDSLPLTQIIAQAMGTASAIIYIMSYVPQAIQNYQRKSCEGLSMWLFLLSMLGNTTYALAILVVSLNPHYLAPYVPWLLGALVPCVIQIVILYQFQVYRH
ncbi:hypothetical protein IW146_007313 [Coemansia sp. RSA 922]|nr:hypothetical protein GGH13_003140 [Coemansia sp. S155-1]KAJ2100966.1 hypothetical protein GGI09_002009 [Coemansia sp. S100]KAJ2107437.1 hypothetical protein IW146_007313 [Coemansia sp. RSA 922]